MGCFTEGGESIQLTDKEIKMSENTKLDPMRERIENLSQEDIDKAVRVFKEKLDYKYAIHLNSCVHCGLCADSCHYHLTHGDLKSTPAYKLNLIVKVFKKYFTFTGKYFSILNGAKKLDKEMIWEWIDSLYGRCSMCGRCSINCSVGMNIPYLVRAARGALTAIGLTPPGLKSTVDTAIEKGNNMGIKKEDWVETVEWIEEEFQDEVGDEKARFPMDKKEAKYFYTVNPREPMFFPLSITAVGKIFYAAKENWTFSSDYYDVTNYGLYDGADEGAGLMSDRLVQSMKRLGCETLVLAECGHGYNSNRWEAPEWLKKEYNFNTISILELVADYIKEGRIKLDPSKNKESITIHDPCNLVRLGGIIETQRFILKHAAENVIEMTPNKQKNFCCGGGGGQLSMSRFSERRIKAGKVKADQIAQTKAKIVATPCHNCIDQLTELNKHYDLNVKINTICEIVANAIVL